MVVAFCSFLFLEDRLWDWIGLNWIVWIGIGGKAVFCTVWLCVYVCMYVCLLYGR